MKSSQGHKTSSSRHRGGKRLRLLISLVILGITIPLILLTDRKPPETSPANNPITSTPPAPKTLAQLLALPASDLSKVDIARMNLLCAQGLPGAENMDIQTCLATLDQWAAYAKSQTDRNYHHFLQDPAYFYNSESFYKMLMLAVVAYEDLHIRYNPKWIMPPSEARPDDHFFADSRDVLVHGLASTQRMGTCSSMPVLYIALGRRLGYPLNLVRAKQHLFLRWDSPTERFNMDATGKGLDKFDDDHYRKWPAPISDQEIKEQDYLTSLSPGQELAVFLSIRAACLTEAGRLAEATEALRQACRLAPNWKGNQLMLAEAEQRLNGHGPRITLARRAGSPSLPANPFAPPPVRRVTRQAPRPSSPNPLEPADPNPLQKLQNPL